MKYSQRDLNILALTIYGEARGEPHEGKVGVAWSVRNRTTADLWNDDRDDWWGEGIAGVCLRSWQYSCWNRPNQPQSQRERLERFLVGNDVMRGILKPNARADDDLEACWRVASAVLGGHEPDPTCGSTHYYLEGSPEPAWARGKTSAVKLGRHLFFNDIEDGYAVTARASEVRAVPGTGAAGHLRAIREHVDALEVLMGEV